jgi:hypothetical protein
MDPRAGLDDVEKRQFLTLPGLELRLLSRPGRSQSLYRLSYPGSLVVKREFKSVCMPLYPVKYSLHREIKELHFCLLAQDYC